MNRCTLLLAVMTVATLLPVCAGESGKFDLSVLRRPLSKVDALNIALTHNGTILQAKKDVEAATGVSIQVKAIIFPQVTQHANYALRQDSAIEANQDRQFGPFTIDFPPPLGPVTSRTVTLPLVNNQAWDAEIQIVQSIYEGGRLLSAVRSSKLIREQAFLQFESIVADTLLSVSISYDDVLSTARQIEVRQSSVQTLTEMVGVTKTKAATGAVTDFEVLRYEVETANEQAALVQAIGAHRVAKQVFVEQLGQDLSTTVSDDLSLNLTSPLEARPYDRQLSQALAVALVNRTEIAALQKEELLRDENIIVAKAGNKPSLQAFGGYQLLSRVESRNPGDPVYGGFVGAQISWPIFDGFLTKGRVDEAVARRGKAGEAKAETTRIVELQVRSAWSDLRTAAAVLDAEGKNVDKAVRALELVQIRFDEGAATQVEVLSAQTALVDARTTYVQGLRDYSVARARLLRATGEDFQQYTTARR